MPTLRSLMDQRANVWSQMQEVRDAVDKDGWTAELREKWDRADAEIVELNGDIERMERAAALDSISPDPTVDGAVDGTRDAGDPAGGQRTGDDAYGTAFRSYLRHGHNGIDHEQRQLLQARFVAGPDNARAMGITTGAGGGYTVPEGFWARVVETMKFFNVMAAVCEVVPTSTGNPLPWPTNDDTGNEGAILAEGSQVTEQDLEFGQAQLDAYMYTSKLVRVALQLLQDSGIDIEAFLARKLGERLGRITNRHFTLGTGSSQPQGYITGATVGKTTASATAITWDELVDLEHSVDAAYRASGRCRWMWNDLVFAAIRKLRDDSGGAGLGRPLWEPSVQAGVPSTFNGHPYAVNNYMDSTVAATKKTVGFGDFTAGYVIRQVNGGQLLRLEERYADYLQVGFLAFGRFDGLVQDISAIKVLQQHA